MAIMKLTDVNLVLERYGKDAIESMNKFLDENNVVNLQKSMTQKVESKYPVSILTVQMAHYGEYIDSGSKYTTKFPYTPAISAWCDADKYGRFSSARKGNGIQGDKHEFNSATYGVSLKIFKNGIKAKPFLHLFTDLFPFYEEMFAEALKKDMLKSLDKL